MNLKTTLVLALLVGAGCAIWFLQLPLPAWLGGRPAAPAADAGTLDFLKDNLRPDALTRIEIQKGEQRLAVLDRPRGGDWSLPGGWPTRRQEVETLVQTLTDLRSRFAAIPLGEEKKPEEFGLDKPALTVLVHLGDQPHRLRFSEKPGDKDGLGQPAYLRLDNREEVVRLGPQVLSALGRPAEHYQQRRLFPFDRVARDPDSAEKTEQLQGKELQVRGPDGSYTLIKADQDWQLAEPVKDRTDPDKLRTLLAAVSDLWAEQFITPKKEGEKTDYGLDKPEQTVRVLPAAGKPITLLIGNVSRTAKRKVMRPPQPGMPPGMPPQAELVAEEYRYARLQDNDQVFEVKADKFKDLFVKADTLRDTRVARFRTDDVTRVELARSASDGASGEKIVLVLVKEKKEKEPPRWKIEAPLQAEAESFKVTEFLDRLGGLSARDKDILDKPADEHGLKTPAAVVTLTLEEPVPGAAPPADGTEKPKKTRTLTFTVGKPEKPAGDKPKLYVQVAGYPRVNAVEDDKGELLKLLQRGAVAYRNRRMLDFAVGDVAKLEIKRPGESYTLEKDKDAWKLTAPVKADADSSRAGNLADDLGRLEVVEFVEGTVKPEELEDKFGLGASALRATVTLSDKEKKPQTLLVGKQREGKTDFYAKLESGVEVFVVRKELRDDLDRDSLAYRPLDLWKMEPNALAELRVRRGEEEHRLKRDGTSWKVAEPFEAAVPADQVRTLAEDVARLRAERYVAHAAKDLKEYGLDQPALRVTVVQKPFSDPPKATAPESPQERTLLVGKPTEKDPKARYAKLADGEAVFVLGAKAVAAVDRNALDLLDRTLLSFDRQALQRIVREGGSEKLTFQRKKDEWRLVEGPGAPFTADRKAADDLVTAVSPLIAARFVAYGPKADLAKYGLDKPAYTVTISGEERAKEGEKPKPIQHVLTLGKEVEGAANEFYARLDNGPAVFVLPASDGVELVRSHLHYVEKTLLNLKPDAITSIERRMGGDTLEIVKKDDSWHVVKPAEWRADDQTMNRLANALANLRAERIVPSDPISRDRYIPEKLGALVTIRTKSADGKTEEHALAVGNVADAKTGERYGMVQKGTVVGVLPAELSRQLTAAPAAFRDRGIARFADADRVVMERGTRKATFAQVGANWKLTEPISADAERNDLEDFLTQLQRLRADEIVAEKPGDLKPFGLDKPEVRWRVQADGKDVLDLLVGGEEKSEKKEGVRRYAKLAVGDLVFLLDPGLSRRAVAEYRNRDLWPTPLDAVQIERLTYTRDGSSFALVKTGDAWTAAGKPVKPEAIRETLDALAGLKAARYVVDQGADLKLFGLDPPQVTLEIQTPSGKRVLHVGRPEGESKRLYARVPGEKRTDVFVIAEQDAARVVRTLAGFVQ